MNQQEKDMEPGFGTRDMIKKVLGNWPWILVAGLAAGILAAGLSIAQEDRYRADAFVAVAEPRMIFQQEPQVSIQVLMPPTSALVELARSDGILVQVLQELKDLEAEFDPLSLAELRTMTTVRAPDTLLILSVSGPHPNQVATVANSWANVVQRELDELYSPATSLDTMLKEPQDIARLASKASVPTSSSNPSSALVAVIGSLIGAFMAVVWILIRSWWLEEETPTDR